MSAAMKRAIFKSCLHTSIQKAAVPEHQISLMHILLVLRASSNGWWTEGDHPSVHFKLKAWLTMISCEYVFADLERSQDTLRAELAKTQQAPGVLQSAMHQGEGSSAAQKLQAECRELTQELTELRNQAQKARHENSQLQGDLRGRDAELQHYKSQLEEYAHLQPLSCSAFRFKLSAEAARRTAAQNCQLPGSADSSWNVICDAGLYLLLLDLSPNWCRTHRGSKRMRCLDDQIAS